MSNTIKGKKLKPGINTPLICRKCGHKMGMIRLKSRFKWKVFWQAMGIAFVLQFITQLLVNLMLK